MNKRIVDGDYLYMISEELLCIEDIIPDELPSQTELEYLCHTYNINLKEAEKLISVLSYDRTQKWQDFKDKLKTSCVFPLQELSGSN